MKGYSIRLFIGILFTAIGTATLLLSKEVLTAAIWLSFGNGLLLSGYRFKLQDAPRPVSLMPVPKVRLYAGLFLIILAVVLLFLQIFLDMQAVK